MAVQAFDQATSEVREAKGETPTAVHLPLKRSIIPTIKSATAADEAAVIDVVTLAFSTDPLLRWVYPDPHQYLTYAPEVARAFAGKAFAHATAYYVDGYSGAALWLPPEVHPDEDELISLLQDSVSQRKQADLFGVLEQMASYHPLAPHWYLPIIGVDPIHQGQGYGSALLQHALGVCDRDHAVAYLESSNPRNIPLYRRHGFELIGAIQVGASPPIFPMLREAR